MVREARAIIEAGELGAVRIVQVEFALGLGCLSSPIESESKQAACDAPIICSWFAGKLQTEGTCD